MPREVARTAVQATANLLREEILARNESNWYIGSEDDVLERLDVSRPTLRQALRILEHEQLLTVRRGLNGGLFGQVPSIDAVARVAAIYLRSRDTPITELMTATGGISAELARLAATRASDPDSLIRWVEEYQARDRADEGRWMLEVSLDFGRRLADLSGNAPLRLFEEVLAELSFAPYDVRFFAHADRIESTRRYHRRLAEAVASRDPDFAVAVSRHQTSIVLKWLEEDLTRK